MPDAEKPSQLGEAANFLSASAQDRCHVGDSRLNLHTLSTLNVGASLTSPAYAPAMIGDRIRKARKAAKKTQQEVAAYLGIDRVNVTQWEGHTTAPDRSRISKLARFLGVSSEWLLEGTGRGPAIGNRVVVPPGQEFPPDPDPDADVVEPIAAKPRSRLVSIPDLAIFGGLGPGGALSVLADNSGQILDADQVRGYWTFPDYMLRAFGHLAGVYAWEVRGDSMEPTLPGGSVVFVDTKQNTPPPDDIYAMDYGSGLVVKRLKLMPRSSKIAVISDNKAYETDIIERGEVDVYGRVVGWFQWRG